MKINNQPAEKGSYSVEGTLEVVDVFSTIQGEGPFVGTPATFIRLAGCNLTCSFCDTNYTEGRHLVTVDELVEKVAGFGDPLVVLTGGEPLRQNIYPLLYALESKLGVVSQIETNGTLWYSVGSPLVSLYQCEVVCSPKTKKINQYLRRHITAWKYIVAHGQVSEEDGLPTSSLGMPTPPARPSKHQLKHYRHTIYIQPLDEGDEEKNKLHLQQAIQVVRKFGYRLCLQQHKLLGLP